MKLLLIFAFLGAAVAAPLEGYTCPINAVPYQVLLNAGYHFCGGSLIHDRWVLSAANCYNSRIQVGLGEYNLLKLKGWEQSVVSEKVIRHPQYNSQFLDNNIMLIKLRDPAKLSSRIAPIGLGNGCATPGSTCLISGWGHTFRDGVNYPEVLNCLKAPILHDDECSHAFPKEITNNMVCTASIASGNYPGQGDSGGPLACDGTLQGIASGGIGYSLPGYPGAYTKVCNYVSWIKETINAN